MKTIIALSAIIALTRAGQIYHGTTQGDYQTADINQLALQQGQIQQLAQSQLNYQANPAQFQNQNFQNQNVLNQNIQNQNYQVNSLLNGARILSYQNDKTDYGYQYAYETDNGIKAQEVGQYNGRGHVVQGAYSYTGDDGQVYTVTYTADENGFHPQGAHLPTPPPTPEVILKSLEKNARDEANGILDDGAYKEDPRQYENQQSQEQYQKSQYQLQQAQYQPTTGYQNVNYQPTGTTGSYQNQYQPAEGVAYQQYQVQNTGAGHY